MLDFFQKMKQNGEAKVNVSEFHKSDSCSESDVSHKVVSY